jgi:ABC-type Fe3+-hydroxamate transport system substrate-binding protein
MVGFARHPNRPPDDRARRPKLRVGYALWGDPLACGKLEVVRVVDARGRVLEFAVAPRRIVSLVPSHTETLFALGAGGLVVGATEYCVHPEKELLGVPRVGGTKNPRIGRVLELAPDVVIANREENRRADVERLEAAGVPVLVTYARTAREAVADVRCLGELSQTAECAEGLARRIEDALERARARAGGRRVRYLALIWKGPYMAVGPDTFAADLLAACGGTNPLPAEGPRRYPRLDERAIESLDPQVILLPTEPYPFQVHEREPLLRLQCAASRSGRVHVVEGELLTWYGPRMERALDLFTDLLHENA